MDAIPRQIYDNHLCICLNKCIDCGKIHPVYTNFLLEIRCPPCQAQFRIDNPNHPNPQTIKNSIYDR